MSAAESPAELIYFAALAKESPQERAAYLDEACGADADLRRRVERLLEAQPKVGSFLEGVPGAPPATAAQPEVCETAGAVIGPYKLIEQIGEGGMGTVWMAQQAEPVKRLVALKLIKAGMDSKQVIARFEAERQALALMDHPNIARVIDGGTTPPSPPSQGGAWGGGRPYFVMDLVKGVPITRYCDEQHLTPRQRLELFIPLCQAVQHAHQKGIIHRDLKPSNVLVALYDGKPVPKVIDFGVAKAAGQTLTDKTLVTGFGNIVGTLEYMSPEQAEINQLDIDTRSDIYSLGVLLYELLTGSPPFTRKELEKAGMLEMLRVIREQEPSKPSTKLSTAEGLPTLAANRGTEPAKLTRLVRGELDWIVMKALEKDRNRRYETANGFALDVQRYLADEPVQACPPSVGYRLRKFVRRNRRLLLAAGVMGLVAATAIGSLGWAVGDRMERRAAADRGAEAALEEAHDALNAGRRQAARIALDRANGYLVGAGDGLLAVRSRYLSRDLTLLDRLDGVRVRSFGRSPENYLSFDFATTDAAFAETFGAAGLDLDGADVSTVVAQFAGRTAWVELAAALDDWAAVRRGRKNKSHAQHLLAVARRLDPDPWRNQIRDAVDRGTWQSLKVLAQSPELADRSAGTIYYLAKALADAGAGQEAAAILTAVQPRHAGDFWVNYTLGNALENYRSGRSSTPYFMAAAALRPNDTVAAFRVARALAMEKDPATHGWWDQVAQHHPTSASMHWMRGRSLRDAGDLAGAIAAWKEALRLQPDHSLSQIELAVALVKTGAYEEAVQVLDAHSRQLPPDATFSNSTLGTVHGELTRITEVLSNGPDPKVRNPRLALRAATRLVELNPKDGYCHCLVAMALYRAEEYRAALEVFARPVTRGSQTTEQAFCVAMAHAQLGEVDQARRQFNGAVYRAQVAKASDGTIRRLAAEAAEVVGVKLPPSLVDGPESPVPAPTLLGAGNWTLLDRTQIDEEKGTWKATLTWEPVPKATHYHLQLRMYPFPAAESKPANPTVPGYSLIVDNALVHLPKWPVGSRLHVRKPGEFSPLVCRWRVRALVGDAWTAWSPEQTLWVTPPAFGEPKPKK